jgi:hypothetical protein
MVKQSGTTVGCDCSFRSRSYISIEELIHRVHVRICCLCRTYISFLRKCFKQTYTQLYATYIPSLKPACQASSVSFRYRHQIATVNHQTHFRTRYRSSPLLRWLQVASINSFYWLVDISNSLSRDSVPGRRNDKKTSASSNTFAGHKTSPRHREYSAALADVSDRGQKVSHRWTDTMLVDGSRLISTALKSHDNFFQSSSSVTQHKDGQLLID